MSICIVSYVLMVTSRLYLMTNLVQPLIMFREGLIDCMLSGNVEFFLRKKMAYNIPPQYEDEGASLSIIFQVDDLLYLNLWYVTSLSIMSYV